MPKPPRRRWPWFVAGGVFSVWMALGVVVTLIFMWPNPSDFPPRADLYGHPCQAVTFPAEDGVQLAGWYGQASDTRAVLFCGGINSDRRQGLSRAERYLDRGYSVLLMDLRGTGESASHWVTYGLKEQRDARAALAWLGQQGYTRIGMHGISLGAATVLMAHSEAIAPDFVVLESPFDTLDNAWNNRLDMVGVPRPVGWPVRWFTTALLGAPIAAVDPLAQAPRVTAPTLHLAGDAEAELPVAQTEAIFAALGATDKVLYLFPGAGHDNFLGSYAEQYMPVFNAFLDRVEAQWATSPEVPAT